MSNGRFKDNDDLFDLQATGLKNYLRANKTRFNLSDATLDALDLQIDPFHPALLAFQNAARAFKTTSDAKTVTRKTTQDALGKAIDNLGDKFTNDDRIANDIPPLEGRGPARVAPTETPILVVKPLGGRAFSILVVDSDNPTKAGKPDDADDCEIRWDDASDGLEEDPDDWHPGLTPSDLRSAVLLKLKEKYVGKKIGLIARYRNNKGAGPWCSPVVETLA